MTVNECFRNPQFTASTVSPVRDRVSTKPLNSSITVSLRDLVISRSHVYIN